MNQLLTFASCRDYIDECAEKLKQVQRSLRAHQYAEIKRERDEAQFWWVVCVLSLGAILFS